MATVDENDMADFGAQCAVFTERNLQNSTLLKSCKSSVESHGDEDCSTESSQKEISGDSGYFSTSENCLNLDDVYGVPKIDSQCMEMKDGRKECEYVQCCHSDKGKINERGNSHEENEAFLDGTDAREKSENDLLRLSSRCNTFINENYMQVRDKQKSLFADERTFKFISEPQKEENNAEDDDEDDPFYLSIRMLAKLPMIAGKPRFKTGSITDTGFQPRVKPLYGKPENKVTIPNSDVPPLDKPKTATDNAEGAGRGRIMSTGHALPSENLGSASAKAKNKIVVKESKEPKEKKESVKKTKKKKKK